MKIKLKKNQEKYMNYIAYAWTRVDGEGLFILGEPTNKHTSTTADRCTVIWISKNLRK